jgi:hypothetical protein
VDGTGALPNSAYRTADTSPWRIYIYRTNAGESIPASGKVGKMWGECMATLTRNALDEIIREKYYSPDAILPFLWNGDNFISVSVGIKRELARLGFDGDDSELLENFKKTLEQAGFNKDERKHAKKWLIDGRLPSPKYGYPIRLCFALGLSGQAALDFLWKVCRVNGFNFRRAEDIAYCYCLENGKTYADAKALLARYEEHTAQQYYEESDATKRTRTLRSVFGNLKDMGEAVFFDLLCKNKKNFFKYSKTAHEKVFELGKNLTATIKAQIADYNFLRKRCALIDGYDYEVTLYPEIIFAFELLGRASKGKDTPFGDIMARFPQERYLADMFRLPPEATDKEHDKARKAFVLLYFANYALDPPPDEFFGDFVIALNDTLDRCGYAKLYPANPFDWLILKCIRSLDHTDQDIGDNPVELFNEVLMLLAEEETV